MELKSNILSLSLRVVLLLIVPYGIEISIKEYRIYSLGLLIVPYGIEISLINKNCDNRSRTLNRTLWN